MKNIFLLSKHYILGWTSSLTKPHKKKLDRTSLFGGATSTEEEKEIPARTLRHERAPADAPPAST